MTATTMRREQAAPAEEHVNMTDTDSEGEGAPESRNAID